MLTKLKMTNGILGKISSAYQHSLQSSIRRVFLCDNSKHLQKKICDKESGKTNPKIAEIAGNRFVSRQYDSILPSKWSVHQAPLSIRISRKWQESQFVLGVELPLSVANRKISGKDDRAYQLLPNSRIRRFWRGAEKESLQENKLILSIGAGGGLVFTLFFPLTRLHRGVSNTAPVCSLRVTT